MSDIQFQDGYDWNMITAISFNSNVGTFLVYYDISKLSECEVLAFFSAIDGRYLDDPSMLASVREPDVSISLAGTLVSMTVSYALRKLLPVSIRSIMRVWRAFPRVMAGVKCLLSGHISDTRVLDAAAISVAIASGNSRTADNIGFLLSVGETIEEYTKRKSLDSRCSQAMKACMFLLVRIQKRSVLFLLSGKVM